MSSTVAQPITLHSARKKVAELAAARDVWPVADVLALFELPFNDLLWRAQQVHREHFNANEVELATSCRSRPVAARKIVATARNRHITTPVSTHKR